MKMDNLNVVRIKSGKTVIYMICVIVACSVFTIGCTKRLNKIYDYKPTRIKYDGGEVGAKLIGTYKSTKKETIKSSPYELFFWFKSSSKINSLVTVISIELHDIQSNKVTFKSNDILESKLEPDSEGIYCAYFSIKDLDLKYVCYTLILKFTIKTKESVIEKEIKLYFDKDYKEHHSNDFWDRIMSV